MADFSSPFAQLQTGAPDPGKMLGLIGQINQIKDFQAKQAVGEAFQQATDPSTGLTDNGKFMGLVKQNPAAALRAPEAGANSASLTGQYIQNRTSQFGLNSAQTAFLSNLAGSFIGKKGGATDADLAAARTIAARNGIPLALTEGVLAGGPGDTRSPQQRFQDLQDLAMGPGGRANPTVTGVNTAGVPIVGTAGQAMRESTPGAPMSLTPPAAPAAPAVPVVAPTGKQPASSGPPGIATTLPPGAVESARAMIDDQGRQGNFATDIYPLQQSLTLAQKLGPGGMAPGSEGRQAFESYVYGLMPSLVPASMQDKIKNYAELEKYLQNNASQRANNMGPHTNDGLAAATTGSPNVHINDLAGVDLIKAQIGLKRMEYAQVHQASQGGGPKYLENKGKFASQQDPRAYAIDMMSPDQVKALDKSLKGAERAKFNASLEAAKAAGVFGQPGQNAGQ